MQAVARGIKARVQRHGTRIEVLAQRVDVGGLGEKAAPGELIEDVGGHAGIFSHHATRFAVGALQVPPR